MIPQGSLLSEYMKARVVLQPQMYYPSHKKLMSLCAVVFILLVAGKTWNMYINYYYYWIFSPPRAYTFKIAKPGNNYSM
jgi:hypothetical protein